MGRINVLSKQVAELIAAGEVIERPASVIKELVENSIDSGATSVTIEIQHGGITFMRVSDNGCGIMHDDVKNAFLRHATSKIKIENDLDSIATLGFRGEALASICAVSKVQLITKSDSEELGTEYVLEGGEEKLYRQTGCPQGTTFVVRDLFYNVPARMKFLKKDVAESNAVSTLIDRIALSHPEISFTLIRDGRQTLKTSGTDKLFETVYQVFGKQFYSSLVPCDYEFDGIAVSGFVSKPESSDRASRSMQTFFVNGRYVRTKTAVAALEQAYRGSIMVGKFPSCVLSLTLDPSRLDVNVHPAKLEIRFNNERPIYDCVYYAVKSAIAKYDPKNSTEREFIPTNPKSIAPTADRGTQLGFSYGTDDKNEPQIFVPPKSTLGSVMVSDVGTAADIYRYKDNIKSVDMSEYIKEKIAAQEKKAAALNIKEIAKSTETTPEDNSKNEQIPLPHVSEALTEEEKTEDNDSSEETTQESSETKTEMLSSLRELKCFSIVEDEQREPSWKYIGEAFDTYLIIEYSDDRLMFIDKHAAHERLIYEQLKKREGDASMQMLLEPVTVTLDKAELEAVSESRQMLLDSGFDAEPFGEHTVIIRAVPIIMKKLDISEQFMEIAEYLVKHRKVVLTEKMEWLYQNTACRAAIKAGNKNSGEELIKLAVTLEQHPEIKYCPHGRPIYFFMSKKDLEKGFRRI